MIRSLLLRILKEITEPICIKPKLIMGIIILVFLTTIYEVQITDLIQQNANDYLMLACEAMTEAGHGCDFAEARADHADMLQHYIGRMENKRVQSWLLQRLYPNLSPDVRLNPVLKSLREEQGEDRKRIQTAAGVLLQFARDSEESSDLRPATACYEISFKQGMTEDVNNALTESQRAVTKYEEDQNMANAEMACRANRKAIAFVYPVRCSYQDFVTRERLKQFRHDIDRTIYYNNVLKKTSSIEDRELLDRYSSSELRRLRIIQAILDEDMEAARTLLTTAIEEAYRNERKIEE